MFWPILFRKTWPLLFDMLMVLFLAKTPQSFLSNSSIQADTHFLVFFASSSILEEASVTVPTSSKFARLFCETGGSQNLDPTPRRSP